MLRTAPVATAVALFIATWYVPRPAAAEEAEAVPEVQDIHVDEGVSEPAPRAEAAPKRARATGRSRHKKVPGHVVDESQLRAEPAPRPSGRLHLYSINLDEEIDVNIYNDDGSYNVESLEAANHILRCKRTDAEREIEPRLLVILSQIGDHFGKRLDIVSGFRNQRRQTSYHFKGSASDIRIAGVSPKTVRAFAETLDAGGMGIGYYPRSQFVHVDVRPPPSYRWIDNSRPNPNAPDKRPPRGWKRKKLQS